MPDLAALALARQGSFWLKEALQGRDTRRLLTAVRLDESLTSKERQAKQWRALRDVVRRAACCVPHYARSWAGVDLDEALSCPDAFADHVPLLTRRNLQDAGGDMVDPAGRGRILHGSTSGSSGHFLHFHSDEARSGFSSAARIRARQRLGVAVGDREVRLMGEPWFAGMGWEARRAALLERVAARPAGVLKANAFSRSDSDLAQRTDLVARFQPRVLSGYGGALLTLADYAQRAGRQDAFRSVKCVIFASEPVYDTGKRALAESFGAQVAADYVCHEMGMIAHECPAGNLHLNDDFLLAETLDDDGTPVVGEPGRLVLSDLMPSRTPYLRYELGDLAVLASADERCSCGAPQRMLSSFVGRKDDRIRRPDGTYLHPFALDYLMIHLPQATHWQTRLAPPNRLTLLIEIPDHALAPARETVLAQLRHTAGTGFACMVAAVDRIDPLPNGKYQRVVREPGWGEAN